MPFDAKEETADLQGFKDFSCTGQGLVACRLYTSYSGLLFMHNERITVILFPESMVFYELLQFAVDSYVSVPAVLQTGI
ncbi:Integrin beta-like protein [Trichinella pseudospiralis]